MIKLGTYKHTIPAHTQLHVEGQEEFSVWEVDKDDKPVAFVARSKDREVRFVVRKEADLKFVIAGQKMLSIDARSIQSDHETVSDIPYEVPSGNENQTLEDKLKRYLLEMVEERYGENSNEVETFEDAMDLEWEDDDPLAAFEPKPVIEEEPIEATAAEPEPKSTSAEPEPETDT